MAYADLSPDGKRIVIQTSWAEKDTVKMVPGVSWDPDAKVWSLPVSWAACLQVRGVFGDAVTVGDALNQWAWSERTHRVDPALAWRDRYDGTDEEMAPGLMIGLRPYQECGVQFLLAAGRALLADEMGTGKTVQMLETLRRLGDEGLPAVVVCPKSVMTNWRREAAIWFPDARTYLIQGSAAERKKITTAALGDPTALVIINVESVRLSSRLTGYGSISLAKCRECDKRFGQENITPARCEVHPKDLNRIPFKTIVIDEAHRIKDPKSKQSRAVWALAFGKSITRAYALTGTPIGNNPADLWAVMHPIAPDDFPSRTRFVDRYCLLGWNNYGGMDVLGTNPVTRDEFYQILDPRMRRMLKTIVAPDLPPKVRVTRHVELSTRQAKAYREMDKHGWADIDETFLLSPEAMTNALRLMQLSSSWMSVENVPDPTPEDPEHQRQVVTLTEPSSKLDELMDVLDEIGDAQAVVAFVSSQVLLMAARRLDKAKISYGTIAGFTSGFERQEYIDAFDRGKIRVMLITVGAGGTGVNLQAAPYLINMQRSWSMIENVQTENRVHRIGSERHSVITIIDIIATGTIEARQMGVIADKLDRLDEITRDRATLTSFGRDTGELDVEENQILNYVWGGR